ncbi:MAG: hypothetical protein JJT94_14160 [Bernardetiaceae bacterium]|nr:hypothetical protein [Bernardetiaceae bacterium]
MRLYIYSFFALYFVFSACQNQDENINPTDNNTADTTVYEVAYGRQDPLENALFSFYDSNRISYDLQESSGIASGRKNEGVVYIHEDSGNRPVIFVYDEKGLHLGNIVLQGAQNRDWEDIAVGEIDGETYIFVADFGDNRAVREHVRLYIIPEPDLSEVRFSEEPFEVIISDFETVRYAYPDGPRDAETLMFDPMTKDLIIVTKREVNVHVYQMRYPYNQEEINTVIFRGALPFRTIVAGDISPDGNEILIKDYGRIFYWKNLENNIIKTMFVQTPEIVAYIPEVQGEAVGWSADGDSYFTISERSGNRADAILYHYKRQ